jgi:hypothetical protein
LIRGGVMAVLHAAAYTGLDALAARFPASGRLLPVLTICLLVGIGAVWAGVDGWLRVRSAGMVWFKAALLAGPVSGLLHVVSQGLLVDNTGIPALGAALTGGAAFTALVILAAAGLGLVISKTLEPPVVAGPQDGPVRLRSALRGLPKAKPGKGTKLPAGEKPSPRPRT